MEDLFDLYLEYSSNTEIPAFFSRWCLLSGIGSYLGRSVHLQHGHTKIYPNMYCMLVGSPGTRKSSAIKMLRRVLTECGYSTWAAEKTSKEKFLADMEGSADAAIDTDSFLDSNLFGSGDESAREIFIAADEFNDFIGTNNLEFISLLGTLWDYTGTYRHRLKTGRSVVVHEPTVSILGGNTQKGFSIAFPPDILSQGFFSRLLLIYGESNGKSIPFPEPPDATATQQLVERLQRIKQRVAGTTQLDSRAKSLLEQIYRTTRSTYDPRFETYFTRRFNHLLKLCLILSASREASTISELDVIRGNTVLTHTERLMPKALGEFGRAKNADVTSKVISVLVNAQYPMHMKEIWKYVATDLDRMDMLAEILRNLNLADRITMMGDGRILPRLEVVDYTDSNLVDWSYLTTEERGVQGEECAQLDSLPENVVPFKLAENF